MFMATVFISPPDIAVSSKSVHMAFFTCLNEGGASSCPFAGKKADTKEREDNGPGLYWKFTQALPTLKIYWNEQIFKELSFLNCHHIQNIRI